MDLSMEEVFINVAEQVLVQNRQIVTVAGDTFSVISTPKQKLKQVDFRLDGRDFRGLQQNPDTKSRWAELARNGKKVMQFLEGGRYVAAVADGKCIRFDGAQKHGRSPSASRASPD
jgi:hypothetical protein